MTKPYPRRHPQGAGAEVTRSQARYAVHMLLIRVLCPGVNWL